MNAQENSILIVRCGEVALKGRNKPYFERVLAEGVRKAAGKHDGVKVERREGLIFVSAPPGADTSGLAAGISKVFGVASVSPAAEADSNLEAIGEAAVSHMRGLMAERDIVTFKVEAKRADKSFPFKSPEIGSIIGEKVLAGCDGLKVDVRNPDCFLYVDVRKGKSYVYDQKIAGFGGLPLGTNGKGLILLSGGIDSPVAAFLMAKRGMLIEAVHFHAYPYTSERAQQKVKELLSVLASYCGRIRLHMINLLPVQEQIAERCPEEEATILARRFMMRIAEKVAERSGCGMLITGENLGQVASQTAEALAVTDDAVRLPVMRPLIAFDKVDIIDKAREIGTYDISIQPYEDCCTVFLPKHPTTRPRLEKILISESLLDAQRLMEQAVESEEAFNISR